MKNLLIALTVGILVVVSASMALSAAVKGVQRNKNGVDICWESSINPFELPKWQKLSAVMQQNGLVRVKIANPDLNAKIKVAYVWLARTPSGIMLVAYAYKYDGQEYFYRLAMTSTGPCYKQISPKQEEA